MPHFIRVEDRLTGHQYDVAPRAFDEARHKKLNSPRRWPDLTGASARPRPALIRTPKSGAPALTTEEN